MSKRIFSLILAIALILVMLPTTVPSVSAAQLPIQTVEMPTTVNPLYDGVLDAEDFIGQLKALERPAHTGTMTTMAAEEYLDAVTAVNQISDGLKARAECITVRYYVPYSSDVQNMEQYVKDTVVMLFAAALEHTGDPTEGDYLLWQLGGFAQSQLMYFVKENEQLVYIEMPYLPIYYTSAAQEAEMNVAVETLLTSLDLEEADTYTKIKTVYDYICANVTYDDANLNDESYLLKYTAYAALVDGTAVCQGYAVLFYRLMLELGIDARVITGVQTSTDSGHAWNIVELYGNYYNVDSTWDAGRNEYSYFLRNNENFLDHTRDDIHNTAAFQEAYPIGETDFNPAIFGQCGDNAFWSFDEATGTLTITGEGAMDDYQVRDPAPWFNYHESVVRVVIESGITTIGSCAFNTYPALQTIEIPDTVQAIGRGAFTLCSALTDITLPEGITIIESTTFSDCRSLTSITLPSTLEKIEMLAFSHCTALTSVVIPDSVTAVGRGVFNSCSSLTSVQIGTGLTAIGDNMFNSCTALTSIEIPANVTEISYEAFAFCTGLTEITFLGDAPSIYDGAFYDVTATVQYPADNDTWTEEVMQQYGGTLTWVVEGNRNGWVSENGSWYYYVDNVKQTGWQKINGYWYYMNSEGVMQTGWQKINGYWYYFASGGAMKTGWVSVGGKWYYMASGGAMQTGWVSVGGKWYYMASGGVMQTGWVSVGGKWYYMASGGAMQTGWIAVGNSRYYLDSKGVMKTGWIQLDGTWYYLTSSGKMATGWTNDGSYWYYMDGNGMMQRGWITVNGKWYYLNKSGVMQTGWLKDGNYWYYLDATGAMVTGTQVINGKTYVFNKSGVWIG